jgi:hypothetical protein
MATMTLLDWILSILRDPDERAAFQTDPDDYAEQHGFGDLSSADVHDALWLIADNQSASYDHSGSQMHYPPPQHYHNDDHAGHYLNHYITNNYSIIDDRDNVIDNSVHQDVDTGGGDFDQVIDHDTAIASGEGSTAIGEDNNGDISSAGHDSTTAFGDGDATHADFENADFGAGSAVNVGSGSADGDAGVDVTDSFHAEDNDSLNVADDDTTTITHEDTDIDDHSTTHTDVLSHDPVDVDIDDNTVDVL